MLQQIDRLFEEQLTSWPLLARGTAGLKEAQTRTLNLNGYSIQLRHLPHRIGSTTAAVDQASIAKRPCFLCASNLPAEEKGLSFNSELTIYCNPFPILDRHMTIVHRDHRPQRIAGQIANIVAVADALPGYFVIYNGPECGASAPDHLHFQACSAEGVPIISDVDRTVGQAIPNYGRRVVVLRETDRERLIAALSELIPVREPEPLLNLAIFRKGNAVIAAFFPRRKHRPDVFYSGELTVSPATIDLCGVFVTPVQKDFERISPEDIRRIYDEVAG
jgi:hypothetical protein